MKNTSHIAKSKYPSPLGGETERGLVIGITDCGKWKNYHDWIARPHDASPTKPFWRAVGQASENILMPYELPRALGDVSNPDKHTFWSCKPIQHRDTRTLNLSSKENNLSDVEKCDGIILSGGEDVHPRFYNKPEYLPLLDLKEINERRDEFELKVIEKTLKDKKPLLGICRGLQIANVYFGGTLIPHLSTSATIHSKKEGNDQMHKVFVEKKSFLWEIVLNSPPDGGSRKGTGIVNSAHHQAAAQIGNGLVASAFAEDGIVEAMEYKNPDSKSFLLLVQWHPERMQEQNNPFAKNIKQEFLRMCSK